PELITTSSNKLYKQIKYNLLINNKLINNTIPISNNIRQDLLHNNPKVLSNNNPTNPKFTPTLILLSTIPELYQLFNR
ncbi:hypothetical protein NEIRO02_2527, partial [Nematocida sp. AWRm79]